jgi:hypothetical protein
MTAFNKRIEFNSVAIYFALSGTVKLKPIEALRYYLEETRVPLRYMFPNASLSLAVWNWDYTRPSDVTSKQVDVHSDTCTSLSVDNKVETTRSPQVSPRRDLSPIEIHDTECLALVSNIELNMIEARRYHHQCL